MAESLDGHLRRSTNARNSYELCASPKIKILYVDNAQNVCSACVAWPYMESKKDPSCSRVPSSFIFFQQMSEGYMNNNSNNTSQPATPGGALPVPSPLSPSPASLSSYHGDDSDSISSPPWPLKTPCSPVRTRLCIFNKWSWHYTCFFYTQLWHKHSNELPLWSRPGIFG